MKLPISSRRPDSAHAPRVSTAHFAGARHRAELVAAANRGILRRDPEMGIDTVSSAVLEFPGGGHSTFTCSTRAEPYQRVHIVGTQGRIEIEIPFNIPPERDTRIFVSSGGDAPVNPATDTVSFAPIDQYTIQAEILSEAVLDGTPYPVPIQDAVANMKVIEAILGS